MSNVTYTSSYYHLGMLWLDRLSIRTVQDTPQAIDKRHPMDTNLKELWKARRRSYE